MYWSFDADVHCGRAARRWRGSRVYVDVVCAVLLGGLVLIGSLGLGFEHQGMAKVTKLSMLLKL